jgi:hypothetical protein
VDEHAGARRTNEVDEVTVIGSEPRRGIVPRLPHLIAAVIAGGLLLVACGGEEDPVEEEPVEEEVPVEAMEIPEVPTWEPEPVGPPPPPPPTSFLTGLEADDELLERPLLMVKIENSPQSRPQTGLDAADVVIEETVEAGITRFVAFFHSTIPDDVGPTRSARPVDAQIVAGFGRSGFIYSGARGEVRRLLSNTNVIQITEGGAGFYRLSGRRAPHNLYNRLPQALAAVEGRDPDILDDIGWVFDPEPPEGAAACPEDASNCDPPGQGIEISMSSSYRTGWQYDDEAGVYRRSQNGNAFTVTGEGRIGADNVVVLATRHYLGEPNCHGARCPETDVVTDGANAIVLRDGERYDVRWRKPSWEAPIELLTEDGEPFPLKPGRTWLHLPDASRMPSPVAD